MSAYVLAPACEDDLDTIWEYIAKVSIDAADRWIAKLFDAFETLAQNPGIGHARKDLTHLDVRFWSVASYVIVYRSRQTRVEIVAVTQGSRDIPTFLRKRNT